MIRLPRSLLVRTFLLLSLLVTITTVAWLFMFRYLDAEPRARETAQLAGSAVNLIRAGIFAAAPANRPALFAELASREGIRLLPAEAQDSVIPLPETRYFSLLRQALNERLGPNTRIAAMVDGEPGFWISFYLDEHEEDVYWLILPSERLLPTMAGQWLLWAPLAFILALAMAAWIASRISRPLRAMARSATAVGKGQAPELLPEEGPEELRNLALAFNRMASDLAQHESERAEVLAGISHDLRTPLTRLRLEAEMSIHDPAARDAAIADIEQMDAVLSQFMRYAKGTENEERFRVHLQGLLGEIAARERARGRPLELVMPAELPPCLLYPKAMTRAIQNLIDNAWQYGEAPICIEVRVDRGMVGISVQDAGTGVPEDALERIKQPFTRLEGARTNANGTGLGLAIVERVARLHGGRLTLENRPSAGLMATLWWPADQRNQP